MSKQNVVKYGGLAALAAVALGVSGVALSNARPPSEGVVATTLSPSPAQTAAPKPAPAALKIKLPADPRLLFVGDSYTAGVGADNPAQGWANVAARALGYPFRVDGVGGTGFAWGGGSSDDLGREYAVRLEEAAADGSFAPNVVILQGGQNDSLAKNDAAVTAAVKGTVDKARKLWPGAQVVVLGPSAPLPLAADLRGVNGSVRAGAAAAKAPFIDANEAGWFTNTNSEGFNFDGSHVNTAGHRYIADKFLVAWDTITAS